MRPDPSRPRRHGYLAFPRLHLHPCFVLAVLTAAFPDGTPMPAKLIALDGGFRHPQRFSNLLHAPDGIPVSTRPLFERVARLLRHPADKIFVEPVDATPRLVKRTESEQPSEASA